MTAKPYTPEEMARWREMYRDPDPTHGTGSASWAAQHDVRARFLATIDALEAELARLRAPVIPPGYTAAFGPGVHAYKAVPADVPGLVKRLRDEEAFVLVATDEYEMTRAAADKLEAQARELAAKDESLAFQERAIGRLQARHLELLDEVQRGRELAEAVRTAFPYIMTASGPGARPTERGAAIRRIAKLIDATETKETPK